VNNIATTITSRVLRHAKPWTAPNFETPLQIDASELSPIGEYRGKAWYSHNLGELETRRTYRSGEELPNGPITAATVDGELVFTGYAVHEPGALAALQDTTPRAPRPPRKVKPIDLLSGTIAAKSHPTSYGTAGRTGAPRTAGVADLLRRIESKGARVTLSADGTSLVVSAPGARSPVGVAELIEKAGPLILAYLAGSPLRCTVRDHGADAPQAVSLSLGSTPICAECLAGGAS
jgi:hypothetical protein